MEKEHARRFQSQPFLNDHQRYHRLTLHLLPQTSSSRNPRNWLGLESAGEYLSVSFTLSLPLRFKNKKLRSKVLILFLCLHSLFVLFGLREIYIAPFSLAFALAFTNDIFHFTFFTSFTLHFQKTNFLLIVHFCIRESKYIFLAAFFVLLFVAI